MSYIWLIFLYNPIMAALELPVSFRIISLILTGLFALADICTLAFSWIDASVGEKNYQYFDGKHALRYDTLISFLIQVVLVAAQMPFLGIMQSLNFLPFLVAAATFALPQLTAGITGIGMVAVSFLIPYLFDPTKPYISDSFFSTLFVFLLVSGIAFSVRASVESEQRKLKTAILEERNRLAEDVHDVLGHTLTVIALKTELVAKIAGKDPQRAQAELREINQLARESIEEVRSTVLGLKVHDFSSELKSATYALETAGVKVIQQGVEVTKLTPQKSVIFAWVVREATTNIIRHANAANAMIKWDEKTLLIADDGKGISSNTVGGQGLAGLKDRVSRVGGIVKIINIQQAQQKLETVIGLCNIPDSGTIVEVSF
ncbi:sensor histidine kinase [Arcanobacterium hippocoleae]|uniref:Two-component system sensor histidine kinase DesK n=2 Tax=Arcanobacterium hippocoleae TaxID=149017 RepID=A0ABU1T2D5_9ACTO|nr:two-component system sensor histidine kinase DesK [Arcanobacterium hippocoleae]